MSSDELDKRITIEQMTQVKGASGGSTKTWAQFAKVWARKMDLSGNERRVTTHGGEASEARTEFKIRHRIGVTAAMRVSYGGAYYNIKHVKDLYGIWMILTCDTGVNNG